MAKTKTKKQSKKSIVKQPKELKDGAKTRKKPKYKTFRLHRRIKDHRPRLPSWLDLTKKSFALMKANKKQIAMFALIYGFLNLLLVRGFSSPIDVEGLKLTFTEIFGEDTAGLAAGFTSFGVLVNATTQGTGELAQAYQSFLLIVSSLAIIWLYRQQQGGNSVSMKMAFYRGMYPLVPFILVFLVIGLQLLPSIIGNFLFTSVLDSGLAVGGFEQFAWLVFFLSTVILSLYMVSSSSIALYIVTLPEVEPMFALRQARELVRHRRFQIIRKAFALLVMFFALLFVVVLPVIFIAPTFAEWMFFGITVLALPFIHGYLFSLYRELL